MLNEVLKLTKGDLTKFTESTPFPQRQENGENEDRERNNEAFYKDYQGEIND